MVAERPLRREIVRADMALQDDFGAGRNVEEFPVLARRHAFDRENRKLLNLVVKPSVIAERPFRREIIRADMALQDDFGAGRNVEIGMQAACDLAAFSPEQAGERVFGQAVRNRCHRSQHGCGVRAKRDRNREGPIRVFLLPVPQIQRASTMRQPAHDQAIAADQLLPINTQVLPLFFGPAGYGQTPGHQRTRILGPAGLDRETTQVHGVTLDDFLLTSRPAFTAGRHQ